MQRHARRPIVVGIVIATVVLTALVVGPVPTRAADPERVLSHFLCYLGTFSPFTSVPGVGLDDELGATTVTVLKANVWCNPTRKRRAGKVTPIVDTDQHFKQYPVSAPVTGATADLLVTNQFGADQPISVNLPPTALLVPTKMPPHGRPRGLDHLECHNVFQSQVLDKRVRLRDEFKRYRLKLSQQWLQCIPTAKTHGSGGPTTIRHADVTLACYLIEQVPSGRRPSFRTINQFEPRAARATVDPGRTFQLCVPSRMKTAP